MLNFNVKFSYMDDGVGGDILEGIKDVASAVGQEIKKVGQTAAGQVTGKQPQPADAPSGEEVKKLGKKDKELSKLGEAEVKARINAYYQEYAAKKKKQAAQQVQQEVVQEEEKKEIVQLKKKESADVVIAQAKSNAEVKNYGAE